MSSINPNSSAVGSVSTGGDVSSLVIQYFGEKANDAGQKTQAAVAKAKSDSAINKAIDGAKASVIQDGSVGKVATGSAADNWLKNLEAQGNTTATSLRGSLKDGEWSSTEQSQYTALLDSSMKGTATEAGSGVNDDAVNMALVQAAFQEFQTATNGMSAVVKKSGDTKDAIVGRLA